MGGTSLIVDIAELDCIYLSYDEPQKEEFWAKISAMVPWAKRVDNVKGSDAAHKAAADASSTDRFILIDGDNLPDPEFFNQQLTLDNSNKDVVFRWKARNIINDLAYGNGGLSCWTKDFVYNMRTHEASLGDDVTAVEFCWNDNYWPMHDVWSTTYPNQSPYHAWRAGFREGVKMCLDRGTKPDAIEFGSTLYKGNLRNLSIWHNIGTDVANGHWAMMGAREGTHMLMLQDWDYKQVHDFDALRTIFDDKYGTLMYWDEGHFDNLGKDLELKLGLDMIYDDEDFSRFFKKYLPQRSNLGIMVREGRTA